MPVVIPGCISTQVTTASEKKTAAAYAAANGAAAQAIGNMRTVAAFQAEQPVLERYMALLERPRRVAVRASAYIGTANSAIWASVCLTCAFPLGLVCLLTQP